MFVVGANPNGYIDVGFGFEDKAGDMHIAYFPMRGNDRMWNMSPIVDKWIRTARKELHKPKAGQACKHLLLPEVVKYHAHRGFGFIRIPFGQEEFGRAEAFFNVATCDAQLSAVLATAAVVEGRRDGLLCEAIAVHISMHMPIHMSAHMSAAVVTAKRDGRGNSTHACTHVIA